MSIGFFSCKKTIKPAPPKPESAGAYLPGNPGSYWIFQHYRIHGDSEILENTTDSVWQEADEMYMGKKYKKFNSIRQFYYSHMRDSGQYILSTSNAIMTTENSRKPLHFSNSNLPSYFSQRDITVYKWGLQNIQTPYGKLAAHFMSDSTNFILKGDSVQYRAPLYRAYAQGIGCVMYEAQILSSVPDKIKMRFKLIRYKLK